jgi:leader peptidase (prepilin peptidase)/N-methyltransferase
MNGLLPIGLWVLVFGAIALIDMRTRRIPNSLLAPGSIAALALAALHGSLPLALIAGGAGYGGFWLLRRVSARGGQAALGGGDVKLAGLIGLACGPSLPLALLAGTAAGAAVALALLAAGAPRRSFFPYAPALAFGALFALLWA